MQDEPDGMTVPAQHRLWKQEYDQMPNKQQQYPEMKRNNPPEDLFSLKELWG